MDFIDADAEIEAAAKRTVPEIFAEFGEQAFRDVNGVYSSPFIGKTTRNRYGRRSLHG